jgi:hypothetical protein
MFTYGVLNTKGDGAYFGIIVTKNVHALIDDVEQGLIL